MAAQRRFEGNTLAEVLAKVQKEMGSEAKILSAQRARTGGLMGFFQREKFEVIVEVPDPNAPKPAPVAVPEPVPAAPEIAPTAAAEPDESEVANSILDLVQRISESERKHEAEAPVAKPTAPTPPPVVEVEVDDAEVEDEPIEAPTPRSEVIKADRVELPEDISTPEISTLTDSFAEVLSRVAFQADMTSDHPKSEEGAPVIELEENETSNAKPLIEDRPAYLDAQANAPVEQIEDTEDLDDADYEEHDDYADEIDADFEPQPAAPTPAPSAAPAAAPAVGIGAPVHLPAATSGMRPTPAFRTRVSDHPLATLGLPVSLIPAGVEPAQLQKALEVSLQRLPKAPEVRPSKGSIIAIVGEVLEAIQLAEQLAHKWKRPPEEIVLASQMYKGRGADAVLRNVRNAEDARRSWSRRPRPTIVAIDAYPGSRDTAWAEHMLTALEPIATYGVADATRKAEDIAAWASQLGGIDCLAVNHLDETVSPASILATGIPVERIDGRAATPAFWAMLLAERLSAA